MSAKTDVYSWRVSPELKRALEEAARDERGTVAGVLEAIVRDWLAARRRAKSSSEREQVRLHAAAAKTIGTIRGGDRRRSERAREAVRERLRRRAG